MVEKAMWMPGGRSIGAAARGFAQGHPGRRKFLASEKSTATKMVGYGPEIAGTPLMAVDPA